MKFYETTYIVHSALQEGRLNDIIESVNSFVKSSNGEVLYFDNWGRKKLSYMIEKQKYGTYVFFQFKISDSSKIKDLSMEFEHNPNILRSLIVNIEKEDILEDLHDIKSDNNSSEKEVESNTDAKLKSIPPSSDNTTTDEAHIKEQDSKEAAASKKEVSKEVVIDKEEVSQNETDKDTQEKDSNIEDENKEQ